MLNEEELDIALTDYHNVNVTTTYSYQRWAHSPGRERARRLLIRFRNETAFEEVVPHILAFPQTPITIAIGKKKQTILLKSNKHFFLRLRCCASSC